MALKIAHIVRRLVFEEWGGTETVVWNSVRQQRERGIDAQIFATSALSKPGAEAPEGVPVRRFRYFYPWLPMDAATKAALDKKGGSPCVPDLFRTIRRERFDLIHIHAGGRIAHSAVRTAKTRGVPCVVSVHGGAATVPPEEIRAMLKPLRGKLNYGEILDRILGLRLDPLEKADAVICVGRDEADALSELYPNQRIVAIPNGIDWARFQRAPEASARATWNIPKERRLLLCISRIDYQKNQRILVELLAHDSTAHLLLIGPITSESHCDEVLTRVRELNAEDRFTLVPGLPPGDPLLLASLHEADLFLLPSLHEPFGIAALEAQAAGLPVIASGAGGLKDFVIDRRNGLLFHPGELSELFAAYDEIIGNAVLRERIAARAREDAKAFSWDAIAEKTFELYNELRRK